MPNIPANNVQRASLIRELLYTHAKRNRALAGLAPVEVSAFDHCTMEVLTAMPQGLILFVVERYLIGKRQQLSDTNIFEALHKQLSAAHIKTGHPLPSSFPAYDLTTYVRHYVLSQYGGMDGLTDEYFDYAIKRILAFYASGKTEVLLPNVHLKARNSPSLSNPEKVSALLQSFDPEIGARMRGMFQNGQTTASTGAINNCHAIANRLILIEANSPGVVRMRHNPAIMSVVTELFSKMGYKKPFLTSKHQFIFNTILSYVPPCSAILPTCILAGPSSKDHLIKCWMGTGRFAGFQGMLQLLDFSNSGKDRVPLIIEVEPIFDNISDLLERPDEMMVGMNAFKPFITPHQTRPATNISAFSSPHPADPR